MDKNVKVVSIGMMRNDLYLDLLKKSLTFTLYDETHVPLHLAWSRRGGIKRFLASILRRISDSTGYYVAQPVTYAQDRIERGEIWPQYAHSMIGLLRMDNIQFCVETVVKEGIPGDLIETGVWRGGSCIFMKGLLTAHGASDRTVFVADSFAGLPKPSGDLYPADAGDTHHEQPYLRVTEAQVRKSFTKYGLLDDRVIFLKGWFKDTLPSVAKRKFAVIRLDGDMYESTMDALNNLYDALQPGGFCIIDDYGLEGCRLAVEDYRTKHGIRDEMIKIDGLSVFWRKGAA